MNRTDLSDDLVNAGFERSAARLAVDVVFDSISRALASGERVQIRQFGSLAPLVVPSRMVRNPATGQRKRAKKRGRVRFTPSDLVRDYVTGVKKPPRQRPTA
jgi:DNA-binding protein HU-beta